jgi:hypothetical protein
MIYVKYIASAQIPSLVSAYENKSDSTKSEKIDDRSPMGNGQTSVKMKSFRGYYFGVIFRPRRIFDALLTDSRRLRFGFFAISISVALYTLVYVFLSMGGAAPSSFTPVLAIPTDVYYQYNRFILAPSMFGCWILAAGVAQLLSRAFAGKGSFEDTLSVLGFGIGIATLASLLHDLTDSFLGAIGVLDLKWYEMALNSPTIWRTILWTLYTLSFVFFLVLFPKGIGAAQRIRGGPAIVVGVLSFLVYQGVFFIFNR